MIQVRCGTSRIVLLVGRYALKFPNPRRWENFLFGLIATSHERALGRLHDPALCPVLFALPGGWLLVMPRTTPLSPQEFAALPLVPLLNGAVEHKRDSYGWLNNRIVAVDYG